MFTSLIKNTKGILSNATQIFQSHIPLKHSTLDGYSTTRCTLVALTVLRLTKIARNKQHVYGHFHDCAASVKLKLLGVRYVMYFL